MNRRTLTESERGTLTNALTVAAERFDENAATFAAYAATDNTLARAGVATTDRIDGYQRVAKQFQKQARESRDLYALIENADQVALATSDAPDDEPLADDDGGAR